MLVLISPPTPCQCLPSSTPPIVPSLRSKELWLDAFLRLNGVLSGKELKELADMMRDKEIRVRTDVFEILLRHAEQEAEGR